MRASPQTFQVLDQSNTLPHPRIIVVSVTYIARKAVPGTLLQGFQPCGVCTPCLVPIITVTPYKCVSQFVKLSFIYIALLIVLTV